MNERLTPSSIYELIAEVGFKKYFHLGGLDATRALIDLCPVKANSHVIDIGCASGKTACDLARRYGCNVIGVDILPGMVELAKERASIEGVTGKVDFMVGDAQKLPMGDDLFDIVLGEFITGLVNDKEGAISEYVRVAKPGGTIGLNEATWLKMPPPQEIIGFLDRTVGYKNELFTTEGWKNLLERFGIKQIRAITYKSESLSDPKEDIKDLIRSFPKVLYSLIRHPRFRTFIKMSMAVPHNLLDYFGYGLYVGRT
ncbi:MAG: class I SAM-dependent methyltransferase [Desulfobacterales bacterium]|jgi:ubiquinone/menaquinone biosynthesis C-methylase UbiE